MDICDICNKQPVKIHIEGEGDYCLDCYNAMILDRMGKDDTFDYPRQITTKEPDGVVNTYRTCHTWHCCFLGCK